MGTQIRQLSGSISQVFRCSVTIMEIISTFRGVRLWSWFLFSSSFGCLGFFLFFLVWSFLGEWFVGCHLCLSFMGEKTLGVWEEMFGVCWGCHACLGVACMEFGFSHLAKWLLAAGLSKNLDWVKLLHVFDCFCSLRPLWRHIRYVASGWLSLFSSSLQQQLACGTRASAASSEIYED